jgi:hypothetical protein
MRRFCSFALSVFVLVTVAGPTRAAQSNAPPLHIGDVFPQFSGWTLTGKSLTLPATTADKSTVLIFSFSRKAATDARAWDEHLARDFSDIVPTYAVILLEDAPKLFRGMAVSGIRSGMPLAVQDRTMVLYAGEEIWKLRLHVSDNSRATVVVVGPRGHVRWMNSGAYTDVEYQRLKDKVSASFRSQQ